MPIACKRTKTVSAEDGTESEEVFAYTHFTYKSHWFALSQTEGADYVAPAIPDWNAEIALTALNIERVAFESLNGNTQGYAKPGRQIAVSPVAARPHKTLFHEMGHVILGHCDEAGFSESEITPRDVREVEAEAVALLCCESLDQPGAEFSRGYIQDGAMVKPLRNGPRSASSTPPTKSSARAGWLIQHSSTQDRQSRADGARRARGYLWKLSARRTCYHFNRIWTTQ